MLWPQLSSARVAWSKSCGRGKRITSASAMDVRPRRSGSIVSGCRVMRPKQRSLGAPWAFTQSVVSDNTCPSQPNTRVRYTREDSPVGRWPRYARPGSTGRVVFGRGGLSFRIGPAGLDGSVKYMHIHILWRLKQPNWPPWKRSLTCLAHAKAFGELREL